MAAASTSSTQCQPRKKKWPSLKRPVYRGFVDVRRHSPLLEQTSTGSEGGSEEGLRHLELHLYTVAFYSRKPFRVRVPQPLAQCLQKNGRGENQSPELPMICLLLLLLFEGNSEGSCVQHQWKEGAHTDRRRHTKELIKVATEGF